MSRIPAVSYAPIVSDFSYVIDSMRKFTNRESPAVDIFKARGLKAYVCDL